MTRSVRVVIAVLLLVAIGALLYWQEEIQHSPTSTPTPSPNPTSSPPKYTVVTANANPSNITPGTVDIFAEVKNQGTENETISVAYKIQEPNGNTMVQANNSTNIQLIAGRTATVNFTAIIPLNSKIGKFNVNIEIYNKNQTNKYYSTGFIYPFTTPIEFSIRFKGFLAGNGGFNKTVDGQSYPQYSDPFYWYLGTNHTVSVPKLVVPENTTIGSQFKGWHGAETYRIDGNNLYITVNANGSTIIEALYDPYFTNR